MTVEQVANELGLSQERIRKFCQQGRLGTKVGRQWVITRDEFERFKDLDRPHGRPKDEEGE